MNLDRRLKRKILNMSVSTLERMLKKERDKESKGKSFTRPGSLLRKQVAVKTFAEWNDQQVGFFEADLVAHCGGDISGKFIHTLTMTDIATGWTEILPLITKANSDVRLGMEKVMELLPVKLKGIDCDNGAEFLNYEMVAWCKSRKITFTRSRAYRKNDQAHVEEKNGSVVRKLVGYDRFEGREALKIMTDLYSVSRLYINYFQPSMKLMKKTRIGAKVTKEYDAAKTPLERLLSLKTISKRQTATLLGQFRSLDPLRLLAEMATLQAKLWQTTKEPNQPVSEAAGISTQPVQKKEAGGCSKNRFANSLTTNEPPKQYSIPSRAESKRSRRKASVKASEMQSARIAITEDFIDNAVRPSSGQIIYRDSKLVGFGLRVTSGSKSFIVEHRVNGKNSRVTIGRADLFSVAEARDEGAQLLRQMIRGVEPLTMRNKPRK